MLEDKLLIWKFKRGCPEASLRIYEKYKDDMLTLATALSKDRNTAEDIVHNVFVSLAGNIGRFELRGSLKSYLATCVANRTRTIWKEKQRCQLGLDETASIVCPQPGPEQAAAHHEQLHHLAEKLECIAYEQKEVILLHLKGQMKFRDIAAMQNESINTIQSRYRYGLEKLRSLLNGEAI